MGFIVTPLLITPRLIGQQKKVPMSPRYAAIILVRERKKILSRPPFRTEVYIMKRITSNALLWFGIIWNIAEQLEMNWRWMSWSGRSFGLRFTGVEHWMLMDICTIGVIFFTIRQKGRIPVIFHGILLNVIFPNVLTYLIMAYFQRCTKIVTCWTEIFVSTVRIFSVPILSTVICLCGRFPVNGLWTMKDFCGMWRSSITLLCELLTVCAEIS